MIVFPAIICPYEYNITRLVSHPARALSGSDDCMAHDAHSSMAFTVFVFVSIEEKAEGCPHPYVSTSNMPSE